MALTFGSLFAGIGGIDLGFERAGLECKWQCEIDPYCLRVLEKHWPKVERYGDIRTVTDAPAVDVIAGGFPCQPFSIAGRQRGTEDHRDLWPEMRRVIEIVRPRWVVCENVPQFLNLAFGRTAADLEALGYEVGEPLVFQAGSLGAWHPRARCWIVAHAEHEGREHRGYPEGWRSDHADGRIAASRRDGNERRVLADLGALPRPDAGWGDRWASEPAVARMVHGLPTGLDKDRIRALGNAVVPACAEVIARAILMAESERAA